MLVGLLGELGLADRLPADPKQNAKQSAAQCALVPYDERGVRLPAGSAKPRMWLNLTSGAPIKLISDGPAKHNHQGAKQPNTIHIGSSRGQTFLGKPIASAGSQPGNGTVVRREEETCSLLLQIEGAQCRMGTWWLAAAARGGPAMIPIVNQSPVFEGAPDPSGRRAGAAPSSSQAGAPKGSKSAGKQKMPQPLPPGRKQADTVPAVAVAKAMKSVDDMMSAYAALGE